jgi:hypothetical protein
MSSAVSTTLSFVSLNVSESSLNSSFMFSAAFITSSLSKSASSFTWSQHPVKTRGMVRVRRRGVKYFIVYGVKSALKSPSKLSKKFLTSKMSLSVIPSFITLFINGTSGIICWCPFGFFLFAMMSVRAVFLQ